MDTAVLRLSTNSLLRNRGSYSACPDASFLLGTAFSRLYGFVRKELGIPFLRTSMMIRAEGCLGNHSFDRPEFGLTRKGESGQSRSSTII